MVTGERLPMRLTQKQLAYNCNGQTASTIMHTAIQVGCKITHNKRGKKEVDICEYIRKTGSATAIQIAEKLKIKLETT